MHDIKRTFVEGATCIYISELMAKHSVLLRESNIYTQESFEEVLKQNIENRYKIQSHRICYGRRGPDVKLEISRYISSDKSVFFKDDIVKHLWYIPIGIIERELKNAEYVIAVDEDSYFCATNLPMNKNEQSMIAETLCITLQIKDKITEIEFLNTVLQICPHLLDDVYFLSWKGLMGSLKYLLKLNGLNISIDSSVRIIG